MADFPLRRDIKRALLPSLGSWQGDNRKVAADVRHQRRQAVFAEGRVALETARPSGTANISRLDSVRAHLHTVLTMDDIKRNGLHATFPEIAATVHAAVSAGLTDAAQYPSSSLLLTAVFDPLLVLLSPEERLELLHNTQLVEFVLRGFEFSMGGDPCICSQAARILELLALDPLCARFLWTHTLRPAHALMCLIESSRMSENQWLLLPAVGELVSAMLPSHEAYEFVSRVISIATGGHHLASAEAMTCLLMVVRKLTFHPDANQVACFRNLYDLARHMLTVAPWCNDTDTVSASIVLLIELAYMESAETKDMLTTAGYMDTMKLLLLGRGMQKSGNCAIFGLSMLLRDAPLACSLFLEDAELFAQTLTTAADPYASGDDRYFAYKCMVLCIPKGDSLENQTACRKFVAMGGVDIVLRSVSLLFLSADEKQEAGYAVSNVFRLCPETFPSYAELVYHAFKQ
jgi:hypothetical protein